MKWADYRERLGLGFDDKSKFEALKNKFCNFMSNINTRYYTPNDCCEYFTIVGEVWDSFNSHSSSQLRKSFQMSQTMKELILKYIGFYNSYNAPQYGGYERKVYKSGIWTFFERSLEELNIPYEIIEDEDGSFLFPKGVADFDEKLVSTTMSWLKDYPKAEKAWTTVLRDYSENKTNPSQVADGFRKALESFFQDFFKSEKSFENMLPDYCDYLKNQEIPTEISDDLRKILRAYADYNNSYAKHHDGTRSNVLEYIMYATGNIMRLLIMLKKSEAGCCGAGV